MITLRADAVYKKAGKQYIALITGRNVNWTFERSFIGRKFGTRHQMTQADVDEPGLYELGHVTEYGKSPSYVVILHVGQYLKQYSCTREDAMKIGKGLDQSLPFASIVKPTDDLADFTILTPAEARREEHQADQARTISEAADQCWGILQALPGPDAKRVIAALNKKLKTPSADPLVETFLALPPATNG